MVFLEGSAPALPKFLGAFRRSG